MERERGVSVIVICKLWGGGIIVYIYLYFYIGEKEEIWAVDLMGVRILE